MRRVATDLGSTGLSPAFASRGLELVSLDHAGAAQAAALLLGWQSRSRGAASRLYEVREHGWPGPIMLVAIDGGSGAVAQAIDAGADDAVAFGASSHEVAARVAALLARSHLPIIGLGTLRIDQLHRTVTRDGRPIELLPREYALLLHLARHAGQCFSRAALLAQIWGLRFDPGTNVVEVHVSRLRAKLDRGFDRPMLITERGRGYRLVAA